MEDSYQKPHAIMISFPLQGHITPFVHLALKLASKGFTVTFVHTQSTHHYITQAQPGSEPEQDIFTGARNSGLDIRYRTITDGFPVEFDRSLHRDQFWKTFGAHFPSYVDQLVGEIVGSGRAPDPTCLVSDTFYRWPAAVAKKYNLVNVSFWTEAAMVLSLYYHLDMLIENGHIVKRGNNKETLIDYIPGIDVIQTKDLMSDIQGNDISREVETFKLLKRADFVLCNTVQELESKTILALQQKQPIYTVGPMSPVGFTKTTVATNLRFESDCTQWLDARPRGSVLYVSFGSYYHASKNVIVEMAHGLLLSGVNFIWAIRPEIVSSDNTDFLPVGFEASVRDRGLIVPWCSQTDVISHPAVGGFLTHCGWNSILEGIWCSIPFICFPLMSDQLTNRKLVVDDWKIGINLCDRESVMRDEVSKKINYLMNEKTSGELRREIKKAGDIMQNALATNGSSNKLFDQFIQDVKVKIQKRPGLVTNL